MYLLRTTLNPRPPISSNRTKHNPTTLLPRFSISPKSDPNPNLENPKPKSKRTPSKKQNQPDEALPKTIPRKPRRGRRSEAVAVEDFIRDKLDQTFESIRQQSSQVFEEEEQVLKDKSSSDENAVVEEEQVLKDKSNSDQKAVVEEDDPKWPVDADVGWGIRASEYFDKHSIKNVVGDDGVEIDWEGELDDNYVNEINCLEWESFAFHPSPLIVLVFERYNNAMDNWKSLMELEKAIKVYWNAKDRLPPRSVKIDINIERDLAYALKAKECPQLLFLRGNKILYREKEVRNADELVQMIAHFYYNAKKPSCINDAALAPPY